MPRSTSRLPKNMTTQQAQEAAKELVDLLETTESIKADTKAKIDKAKADEAEALQVYEDRISELMKEVEQYARNHKADWEPSKSSMICEDIRIGFRDGNLTADFAENVVPEEALAKLKKKYPQLVIVEEKLNKKEIVKNAIELDGKALEKMGIRVSRSTRFFIERK